MNKVFLMATVAAFLCAAPHIAAADEMEADSASLYDQAYEGCVEQTNEGTVFDDDSSYEDNQAAWDAAFSVCMDEHGFPASDQDADISVDSEDDMSSFDDGASHEDHSEDHGEDHGYDDDESEWTEE